MKATTALATLLLAAAAAGAAIGERSPAPAMRIADGFDAGLCVGGCPGARWAIVQQQGGRVSARPAPGRAGRALHAVAGPKRGGVTKADLVARLRPVGAGGMIVVGFDLRLPAGRPRDSLQLVDVECATCGEGGNPGIRLYLRHGRLRIDRAKIGIAHAWANDAAPPLAAGRWHRIVLEVRLGDDDSGAARVRLDGREVLAARGRTMPAGAPAHVDRVQIGITANSNAVPAEAWFDDVAVTVSR